MHNSTCLQLFEFGDVLLILSCCNWCNNKKVFLWANEWKSQFFRLLIARWYLTCISGKRNKAMFDCNCSKINEIYYPVSSCIGLFYTLIFWGGTVNIKHGNIENGSIEKNLTSRWIQRKKISALLSVLIAIENCNYKLFEIKTGEK